MSTGASYGYSQQPSYGMGGMGGYGGMGGMYGSYNPYQTGGMGGYSGQYNPFGMSNYGMSNPYAQMGFGGDYSTGYTDPFGSSFSNPFSGGYGTSFGGRGMGGGMGGYNQFGGYGQVGLGYLPPQQPTINDSVANQFMQQYYGGAFGLGGQPQQQPRRQRPRNPFRSQPSVVNPMPSEYAGPTNQVGPVTGGPGLGPPPLEQLGLGAPLPSNVLQPSVQPASNIVQAVQPKYPTRPEDFLTGYRNQPSMVDWSQDYENQPLTYSMKDMTSSLRF